MLLLLWLIRDEEGMTDWMVEWALDGGVARRRAVAHDDSKLD